jgi:threonine/homoserine/homoserine lactone efflux protein
MIALVSAGMVYGLSAGFSPGPLLMLVISQTLRHGIKEGAKVAVAPLLTDIPIIILSLLVLSRLANLKAVLGVISLSGGLFVAYLAYGSFRTTKMDLAPAELEPQSIIKGIATNALNPHPYLFWLTVGGPAVVRGWKEGPPGALAFLLAFFSGIVGAKMLIAWISGKSGQWLNGTVYRVVMVILGALLAVFAFFLIKEGWGLLG